MIWLYLGGRPLEAGDLAGERRVGAVCAVINTVISSRQTRIAVGLILVASVAVGITLWQTGVLRSDAPYVVEHPSPATAKPISLNEAWDLVWAEAERWRREPQLLSLSAAGAYEPVDQQAGTDGRRRYWLAEFTANDGSLLVQLFDGQVVRALEQGGPLTGSRTVTEKPAVDSTEVVPRVLAARADFVGGTGDINGVGIDVSAGDNGRTVITVSGRYRGRNATAKVDAASGEILAWERYVAEQVSGIWYSPDGGTTWQPSNLMGIGGAAVSRTSLADGSGYAAVGRVDAVEIYKTLDGGASWALVSTLPKEAGLSFSHLVVAQMQGQDVLLLSSDTGVWTSADGGVTWGVAAGLPAGPGSWLAVAEDAGRARAFATAGKEAEHGIYASDDLRTWTRVLSGSYRLSESYDRRQVLAMVNVALPENIAHVLAADGADSDATVTLPEFASNAAGAFDGSAPLVIQSPTDIRMSEDGGTSWRTTHEGDEGNVVAALDFGQTGRLLAGIADGGLLSSDDGGSTWQPMPVSAGSVTSPTSADVELGGPLFLSSNAVIARQKGSSGWEPF